MNPLSHNHPTDCRQKAFSALRATILILCACTAFAVSAKEFYEGNLKFRTSGSNAIVIGYTYAKSIAIPTTVDKDYYTVTGIAPEAFKNCTAETITIPYSIRSIGNNAFEGCSNLKTITIPASVESLGTERLFYGCNALENVVFRCNVPEIGEYMFGRCYSMKSISISPRTTSIGHRAFYECTALEEIDIPDDVLSIDTEAFSYCSALTKASISQSVKTIGSYIFSQTPLKELYYDAVDCNVPTDNIPLPATLESVTIGENVNTIPEQMFYRCNVTNILIPDNVKKIGKKAFSDCRALRELTIGRGVEEVGVNAFFFCDALTNVYFNAENCTVFGNNNTSYIGDAVFSTAENVTFGEGVRTIPPKCFIGCMNLKSVRMSNSVTEIGERAFYNCPDLAELNLSSSLKTIGYSAFQRNYALTSVTIPESVEKIGSEAFGECTSLNDVCFNAINCTDCGSSYNPTFGSAIKTLTIGPKVKTLDFYAFHCNKIDELRYNAEHLETNNLTLLGKDIYIKTIDRVIIGENVRYLPKDFLWGCQTVNELHYNATDCTMADYSSDSRCASFGKYPKTLVHAFIGDNVTSIPDYMFVESKGLRAVTIGASVESVGDMAFAGCNNLQEIGFKGSPTQFGIYVFNCKSITTVNIPNANDWAVAPIGTSPFIHNYASLLVSGVKINNLEIYHPGKTINTFYNGVDVENLRVTARELPAYAFDKSRIKTLCLDIENIGAWAFNECTNLSEVYSMTPEPPSATHTPEYVFHSKCYEEGTLYVPYGCTSKYRNAQCWNMFKNIVETDFAGIDDKFKGDNSSDFAGVESVTTDTDDSGSEVRVYNLRGMMVGNSIEGLVPGIYIVRKGHKVSKLWVK